MLEWDQQRFEGPLMSPDVGRREAPGVRRSVRKAQNPWLYHYVDPDYFGALIEPPIGIQTAMREVFGERCEDLKVRLHPIIKRWALYQRVRRPELGDNLWQVVYIACEEPVKQGSWYKIPADWASETDPVRRRLLESFAREIGDYREITKADLELVEPTDKKRYPLKQREAYLDRGRVEEEKDSERFMEALTHDFLSYHFNMACDEANQRAGSGQRMRSVDDLSQALRTDPRFYKREWVPTVEGQGYWRRTKRSREEWETEVKAFLDERAPMIENRLGPGSAQIVSRAFFKQLEESLERDRMKEAAPK